ncbi:MAG: hypothetical protein Q4B60_06585 [Erysipelotrichaceae bacterium]|nr:hypothetical protein [Erysipelotrichaceae bacterium]
MKKLISTLLSFLMMVTVCAVNVSATEVTTDGYRFITYDGVEVSAVPSDSPVPVGLGDGDVIKTGTFFQYDSMWEGPDNCAVIECNIDNGEPFRIKSNYTFAQDYVFKNYTKKRIPEFDPDTGDNKPWEDDKYYDEYKDYYGYTLVQFKIETPNGGGSGSGGSGSQFTYPDKVFDIENGGYAFSVVQSDDKNTVTINATLNDKYDYYYVGVYGDSNLYDGAKQSFDQFNASLGNDAYGDHKDDKEYLTWPAQTDEVKGKITSATTTITIPADKCVGFTVYAIRAGLVDAAADNDEIPFNGMHKYIFNNASTGGGSSYTYPDKIFDLTQGDNAISIVEAADRTKFTISGNFDFEHYDYYYYTLAKKPSEYDVADMQTFVDTVNAKPGSDYKSYSLDADNFKTKTGSQKVMYASTDVGIDTVNNVQLVVYAFKKDEVANAGASDLIYPYGVKAALSKVAAVPPSGEGNPNLTGNRYDVHKTLGKYFDFQPSSIKDYWTAYSVYKLEEGDILGAGMTCNTFLAKGKVYEGSVDEANVLANYYELTEDYYVKSLENYNLVIEKLSSYVAPPYVYPEKIVDLVNADYAFEVTQSSDLKTINVKAKLNDNYDYYIIGEYKDASVYDYDVKQLTTYHNMLGKKDYGAQGYYTYEINATENGRNIVKKIVAENTTINLATDKMASFKIIAFRKGVVEAAEGAANVPYNAIHWYLFKGEVSVAKIGTVGYPSLQAAIDACPDGTATTIVLNSDAKETVNIPAGKNIVIDLNKKSIDATGIADKAIITNAGTLTVKNGTLKGANNGGQTITTAGGGIYNSGTLTVNTVTVDNCTAALGSAILNHGSMSVNSLTVKGCTDNFSNADVQGLIVAASDSTANSVTNLTVSNCTSTNVIKNNTTTEITIANADITFANSQALGGANVKATGGTYSAQLPASNIATGYECLAKGTKYEVIGIYRFDARDGNGQLKANEANLNPTLSGYEFAGWSTAIDDATNVVSKGTNNTYDLTDFTLGQTYYGVWKKNGQVVVTAALVFTEDAAKEGPGYEWDNSTKTLTLNGLVMEAVSTVNGEGISLPAGSKIYLTPNTVNDISFKTTTGVSIGVASDGSLEFDGAGTLNIVADMEGIYAKTGDLVFKGEGQYDIDADVCIRAGRYNSATSTVTPGEVIIENGGFDLTGTIGISGYAEGTSVLITGGSIDAATTEESIYGWYDVTINASVDSDGMQNPGLELDAASSNEYAVASKKGDINIGKGSLTFSTSAADKQALYCKNFETSGKEIKVASGVRLMAGTNSSDVAFVVSYNNEKYVTTDPYVYDALRVAEIIAAITEKTGITNPGIPYDGAPVENSDIFTGIDSAAENDADITYTYYKNVNGTYTALTSAPTDAGSYKIVIDVERNFESDSKEIKFVIAKASQTAIAASDLTVTNETLFGKADGTVAGVTTTYEYSTDNGTTYTACTGTSITGLAAGNVLVRKAADDNHTASAATTVTIAAGSKLTGVVLPSGAKYTITSSSTAAEYGDNVTLTLTPDAGYSASSPLTVTFADNTTPVTFTKNGDVYTATITVNNANSLTVTAVTTVSDTTAPAPTITFDGTTYTSIASSPMFDKAFKTAQNVKVNHNETDGSGLKGIKYQISDHVLTSAELTTTTWTTYDETAGVDLTPTGNYFVYFRVVDNAGNAGYVSTDGIEIDNVAPTANLTNNETYYDSAVFAVTDTSNEITVKDGTATLTKDASGNYTITATDTLETHTVTISDKAGNTTTYTIKTITNVGELNNYKTTKKAAADALALDTDTAAAATLITNAKEAIDNYTYNTSKTLAENKAAIDAIVTQLTTDLANQRAGAAVDELIEAIGDVELTDKCYDDVKAAYDAYFALTVDERFYVTKVSTLATKCSEYGSEFVGDVRNRTKVLDEVVYTGEAVNEAALITGITADDKAKATIEIIYAQLDESNILVQVARPSKVGKYVVYVDIDLGYYSSSTSYTFEIVPVPVVRDETDISATAGDQYTQGATQTSTLHIDGLDITYPHKDPVTNTFDGILVTMNKTTVLVEGRDYEVTAGSVKVNLLKSFLDKLAPGSYNFDVYIKSAGVPTTLVGGYDYTFGVPIKILAKPSSSLRPVVNTAVK